MFDGLHVKKACNRRMTFRAVVKVVSKKWGGSLPLSFLRTPLLRLGGLGERSSFRSGVWGGAPAEIEFGAF